MPTDPPEGEKIAVFTPDHLAVHVEHRATGIAAIDRGVGLDEVVIGTGVDVARPGRDDAGRHRSAQPERIADRDHPVADPHRVAVAPLDRREWAVALDLQDGKVGPLVDADHLGRQIGVVGQDDGDLVRPIDDVVVGHHIAALGDDEAGAERGRPPRRRDAALAFPVLEEIAEEVLERRSLREIRDFRHLALRDRLAGRDIDHRGQQPLRQVGKALRPAVLGECRGGHPGQCGRQRDEARDQAQERPLRTVGGGLGGTGGSAVRRHQNRHRVLVRFG